MRQSYLMLGFSIFLWASAFPGIRFMLRTLDPMPFTSLRLTVTMFMLFLVGVLIRAPLPQREDVPRIVGTGLLGYSGYHLALNLGLDHVTAGQGSFVIATIPIWTTLFAWRFLGEQITRFHIVGTVISLTGVAVLTLSDVTFKLGALFVMLAAILSGANVTLQKSLLAKYPPTRLAVYTTVVGCLPIVVFGGGYTQVGLLEPVHFMVLAYLGAVPIGLGYWLITISLRTLPASKMAQGILLVPPIASTLAWLILDEQPAGNLLLGGTLVLAGVIVSSLRPKRLPG